MNESLDTLFKEMFECVHEEHREYLWVHHPIPHSSMTIHEFCRSNAKSQMETASHVRNLLVPKLDAQIRGEYEAVVDDGLRDKDTKDWIWATGTLVSRLYF